MCPYVVFVSLLDGQYSYSTNSCIQDTQPVTTIDPLSIQDRIRQSCLSSKNVIKSAYCDSVDSPSCPPLSLEWTLQR
jgi:hypothetical protein